MTTRPLDAQMRARVVAGLDLAAGSVVLMLDGSFSVVWASSAAVRFLGDTDELVGRNAVDYLHPDDVALALAASEHHREHAATYADIPSEVRPLPSSVRVRGAGGDWIWTEVTLHNLLAEPAVEAIVVTMRLWSDRPLISHAIQRLADGAAVDEVMGVLAQVIETQLVDSRAMLVWWPDVAPAVAVAPGSTFVPSEEVLEHCERARRTEQLVEETVDDDPPYAGLAIVPIDGRVPGDVVACAAIWRTLAVPVLLGPQTPLHLTLELASLAVVDDRLKKRLRADAEEDPLTGVYNRTGFRDAFSKAQDEGAFPLGVVFIDIDDFKRVNDLHGHLTGDAVLVAIARRLDELDARVAVGRMGGDEFALLTVAVPSDEINQIARRAVEAAARPIEGPDGTVGVTVTAGYSAATSADEAVTLLAHADQALLEGKRGGKNCVRSAA